MASGLPILGSLYSDAVTELVVDGESGWTFRPDQMQDVKSAIDRALSAPLQELNRMGCAARERVNTMTPAIMADHMFAAIDYALATPNMVTNRVGLFAQHSLESILRWRAN
jgi:hypothetical protein